MTSEDVDHTDYAITLRGGHLYPVNVTYWHTRFERGQPVRCGPVFEPIGAPQVSASLYPEYPDDLFGKE